MTITNLGLPPAVTAMLASEPMTRDMFELWDLIHDRAHSHGELPFDPFMIRQRLPFWMYSLEELRCDLTAFHQAGELARGFPFALNVQYGVLFDRLFRFPLTGRPGPQLRRPRRPAALRLSRTGTGVLTWRDNSSRSTGSVCRRRQRPSPGDRGASTETASAARRFATGSPRTTS